MHPPACRRVALLCGQRTDAGDPPRRLSLDYGRRLSSSTSMERLKVDILGSGAGNSVWFTWRYVIALYPRTHYRSPDGPCEQALILMCSLPFEPTTECLTVTRTNGSAPMIPVVGRGYNARGERKKELKLYRLPHDHALRPLARILHTPRCRSRGRGSYHGPDL